jgi:hypothetical protein
MIRIIEVIEFPLVDFYYCANAVGSTDVLASMPSSIFFQLAGLLLS